jgi:hypothetical protein
MLSDYAAMKNFGWRGSADGPLLCPFSLANREFTGNFIKIAASGTPETASNGVVAALPAQIPYSTKQGIILAEQGLSAEEQGILPAKIDIITRCDFSEKRAWIDVRFTPESGHGLRASAYRLVIVRSSRRCLENNSALRTRCPH